MSIGVFDSGVGGLTIHRAIAERLPSADLIYLADQAHMPYGPKSGDEIVHLTLAGCQALFREGCNLIVLGCNTACAVALRQLQHEWLPGFRRTVGRPVNVIGIIVPTIEAATGRSRTDPRPMPFDAQQNPQVLGVFATRATARSRVYEIEIAKRRRDLAVITQPCPELAALIEQGTPAEDLSRVIKGHVDALTMAIGRAPHKVILGSTHYEVVAGLFQQALAREVQIIRQPHATADALADYLVRHREYDPGTSGLRRFLTSGHPGPQNELVETFWGAPLRFEAVSALEL